MSRELHKIRIIRSLQTTNMASAQSAAKKDEKAASSEPKPEQTQQKSAATLEEDDEFEDFPVDGMSCLLPPNP